MKSLTIYFEPARQLLLPFAHFDILQGVFYKLLSADPVNASKIHDKSQTDGQQFKYFCFDDLRGKYTIENKKLHFGGDQKWEIRSADDTIIQALLDQLENKGVFEIEHVDCSVTKIDIQSPVYSTNKMLVSMNTPMTVYETDTTGFRKFYNPMEDRFYEAVENNLKRKFVSFSSSTVKEIHFHKKGGTVRKCVTKYKGGIIEAYYGLYELEGDPALLNFAWYTGLGTKNTQGFGLFKIQK